MPNEKNEDVTDMPIWQNHEQRITALELTTTNIQNEFKEVKEKIDRGNTEQSKKLEIIDKRLMDEFFKKHDRNQKYKWKLIIKVVGSLLGGGSVLYIIIEKLILGG